MSTRIRTAAWLAALVVAAVAARLMYLSWTLDMPGFAWSDPDGYLRQASALTRDGHWRWTWDAVTYRWGGQSWFLPPGYPVFLSLFYGADTTDPLPAAMVQAVLGGLAVLPVFVIGRALHTTRAGFVAAAIYAAWFPSITGRETFVQEQLYLPLQLAALAALAWSLSRSARPVAFAGAGIVFGLAALTRAMPLYALPLIVPVLLWSGRPSRRSWPWTGAFLAGFGVVVLPYVAAISVSAGELVLIDNHGMILQTGVAGRQSVMAMIVLAAKSIAGSIGDKLDLVRGLFIVYSKSWLYHYGGGVTAAGARWMGWFVLLSLDSLFVVTALLTPAGLLLARQRRVAGLLLAWGVVVIGVSAAAGFTGARYRTPFEVVLICAAGAAIAGEWRRPSWGGAAVAGLVSLVLAAIVLPQYRASWQVAVPYGVMGWTRSDDGRWETATDTAIGIYVPVVNGAVDLEVEGVDTTQPVELRVEVEGVSMDTVRLGAGDTVRVRVPVSGALAAFVHVRPAGGTTGQTYRIRTPR